MGRPGLVPLLQPGFLGPRTPSVLREIFFLILINIIIYIHNKYKNIFRFYIFRLLGPRTPSVLHEKKRVSKNDHSCHELLSKKLKKKTITKFLSKNEILGPRTTSVLCKKKRMSKYVRELFFSESNQI